MQTVVEVVNVWYRDAYQLVLSKRFCVNPNEGFTRQLMVCVSAAFMLDLICCSLNYYCKAVSTKQQQPTRLIVLDPGQPRWAGSRNVHNSHPSCIILLITFAPVPLDLLPSVCYNPLQHRTFLPGLACPYTKPSKFSKVCIFLPNLHPFLRRVHTIWIYFDASQQLCPLFLTPHKTENP